MTQNTREKLLKISNKCQKIQDSVRKDINKIKKDTLLILIFRVRIERENFAERFFPLIFSAGSKHENLTHTT